MATQMLERITKVLAEEAVAALGVSGETADDIGKAVRRLMTQSVDATVRAVCRTCRSGVWVDPEIKSRARVLDAARRARGEPKALPAPTDMAAADEALRAAGVDVDGDAGE